MTFARMCILALTTAVLTHLKAPTPGGVVIDAVCVLAIAGFAWAWTSDPLPTALHDALDDYAKKWRGR